jgi:hypothetical protein
MQSSKSGAEPRILRCPHCGAPLDAPAFALTVHCRYCGHNVKLAEPVMQQPGYAVAPAIAAPVRSSRVPIVLLLALAAAFVLATAGALVAYLGSSEPAQRAAVPKAQAVTAPLTPAAPSLTPAPKAAAKSRETRYPLRSLLGIDPKVDIDGSSAHLLGLFPTIESTRIAGELRFSVPLDHPWFGVAQLSWKNERGGKLTTVGLKPPLGDQKLKNQKQIADCLSTGLGKPEVREVDHLAGELSYFWGKHFPKAWANLYSGYLWLSFENPAGVAPITLPQVVRALDRCGS